MLALWVSLQAFCLEESPKNLCIVGKAKIVCLEVKYVFNPFPNDKF